MLLNTSNKFTIRILVAITLVVLLGHCKEDEEAPEPSLLLTINVNGIAKAGSPAGFLTIDNVVGHERRKLRVSATTGDAAFSMSITNWDFQNPPRDGIKARKYDNFSEYGSTPNSECQQLSTTIKVCDYVSISYSNNGKFFLSDYYDGTDPGVVEITKSDVNNNLISGKFEVKVANSKDSVLTISSEFINIYYKVDK